MAEQGFPKGASVAVVPDFKERARKGLPIITVAEKKKEEQVKKAKEDQQIAIKKAEDSKEDAKAEEEKAQKSKAKAAPVVQVKKPKGKKK